MWMTQGMFGWGIGTLDVDLNLAGWAAIAQIALALLALGALIGAIVQIHAARVASRVAITYNYTERFSEITRNHLMDAYGLFLLGNDTPEDRFNEFLGWEPPKQLDGSSAAIASTPTTRTSIASGKQCSSGSAVRRKRESPKR